MTAPPLSFSDPSALSDSLHRRVRRFAELWEHPPLVPEDTEDFESLALAIAQYQAQWNPDFARLVERSGSDLSTVASIPAVFTDAFRLTRVAVHPAELDETIFITSGTTAQESGRHPVRDLTTYEDLALRLARRALFAHLPPRSLVVALAPCPTQPSSSSLGHMMRLFMQHFDGRALHVEPEGLRFQPHDPDRWLMTNSGVQLPALLRACRLARKRSEPLVLLTTSFALVALLEALDGERLPVPERTTIMLTGGFKGRSKELSPAEIQSELRAVFPCSSLDVIGEYGMTELTSQLYERRGGLTGHYYPPAWLQVSAVDPATLEPVPPGEVGLARFVDLGNIDSALVIQTQDQIRCVDGGVELLGRAPGSPARGCSLPFEGLLQMQKRSSS